APEPLLRDALALIVEVTEARQGYLELYDDERDGPTPRWSLAHDFSAEEVSGVRAVISRGVIAEALDTGQTIVTLSASRDERFAGNDSVRMGRIEAVLCVPIGDDLPRGVLYLQNCAHGPFTDADRTTA